MFSNNCGNKLEEPKKAKKKGKGKVAALIIIIVLILGAGGVAAWYFTGDDFNSKRYMKKAEEAFAAGELEEAKKFYEAALERDDTLTDAYLKLAEMDLQENPEESVKTLKEGIEKMADTKGAKELLTPKLKEAYSTIIDIHMKKYEYAEALRVVEEGIAKIGEDTFKVKRNNIYISMIDAEYGVNGYIAAIAMADVAFDATKDASFIEKKSVLYGMMAHQIYQDSGYTEEGFYQALAIAEQGYNETQAEKLLNTKGELYNMWISSAEDEQNYTEALNRAEDAYEATKHSYYSQERTSELYLAWAEECLAQGKWEEAISVLEEGYEKLSYHYFVERIDEIKEQMTAD